MKLLLLAFSFSSSHNFEYEKKNKKKGTKSINQLLNNLHDIILQTRLFSHYKHVIHKAFLKYMLENCLISTEKYHS